MRRRAVPLLAAAALLPAAVLGQTPAAVPNGQGQAPPPGQAPGMDTPAPAPAPPPPSWEPRQSATLILLNKITAQPRTVTVKVGASVGFGSLTIAVRACAVRPSDLPADATAFLDITDSHPDEPGFHGWTIASAPGVSMLEHPVYDVHLAGCA
jgi:hypothetical protein